MRKPSKQQPQTTISQPINLLKYPEKYPRQEQSDFYVVLKFIVIIIFFIFQKKIFFTSRTVKVACRSAIHFTAIDFYLHQNKSKRRKSI